MKYESLITLYLSQVWGIQSRNKTTQKYLNTYISKIEEIVKEGIEKGELKKGDSELIATEIFSFTCSGMMYKLKVNTEIDLKKVCNEFDNMIYGLQERSAWKMWLAGFYIFFWSARALGK